MTKEQLIKMIHIAKSQLKIDDDTYRQFLVKEANKDSTKKMLKHELEKVYDALKQKGFKYKVRKANKPTVSIAKRRDDIQKIRAIWITMGKQGFINDASDKALDAYVERMTKSKMTLNGIKVTAWLNPEQAYSVLESLKQWHKRLIIAELTKLAVITPIEKWEKPKQYDYYASLYEQVLNYKNQFGGKR